jgi:cell division protein FtsL
MRAMAEGTRIFCQVYASRSPNIPKNEKAIIIIIVVVVVVVVYQFTLSAFVC